MKKEKKPPSLKRRLIKIMLILLVLGGVGIALLPWMLSGPGSFLVVNQINQRLAGEVTIKDISLGWFSGPQLSGLTLKDDQGHEVLVANRIDLPDTSLLALVWGNLNLGAIQIDLDHLTIEQFEDGSNSLERALASLPSSPKPSDTSETDTAETSGDSDPGASSELWPTGLKAQVAVTVRKIQWQSPGAMPVVLSDLKFDVEASPGKPICGKLTTGVLRGALVGQGHATMTVDQDQQLVLSDTRLMLDISPRAWREVAPLSQAVLVEPCTLELEIQNFSMPLQGSPAALKKILLDMTLRLTEMKLRTGDSRVGDLFLKDTQVRLKRASVDGAKTTLSVFARAVGGGRTGTVNLHVSMAGLMRQLSKAVPDWSKLTAQVEGKIQDVSLALVDELAQTGGVVRDALGPALSAELFGNLRWEDHQPAGAFTVKANAKHLSADMDFAVEASGITQRQPGKLLLRLTPQLVKRWSPQVALKQPVQVSLLIKRLNVPRQRGQWQLTQAAAEVVAAGGKVLLQPFSSKDILILEHPSVSLRSDHLGKQVDLVAGFQTRQVGKASGKIAWKATLQDWMTDQGKPNWQQARFETALEVSAGDLPGWLLSRQVHDLMKHVVGRSLQLRARGKLSGFPSGDWPDVQMQISAKGRAVDASLGVGIAKGVLSVTSQRPIRATLTPALLELLMSGESAKSNIKNRKAITSTRAAFGSQTTAGFQLKKPLVLGATIQKMRIPLDVAMRGRALVDLEVWTDALVPRLGSQRTWLKNLKIHLGEGTLDQGLGVSLRGDVFEGATQGGHLEISALLVDLLKKPGVSEVAVNMTRLPVSLLDTMGGLKGAATALLGPRIDRIRVTSKGRLDRKTQLKIEVESPALRVAARGTLTPDGLALADGTQISLRVTPLSLMGVVLAVKPEALRQAKWLITAPSMIQFMFLKTFLPFSPEKLLQTRLDGRLSISDISLLRRSDKKPLIIRDFLARIKADRLTEPITVAVSASLDGGVGATAPETGTGTSRGGGVPGIAKLISHSTIQHLVNAQGRLDVFNATFETQTRAPRLPVGLLDQWLMQEGKLADIFGPTADVVLAGAYPGDLDLEIKGQTAEIRMPVHITADHVLTLRQDAVASLQVTPQTARGLLKWGNPLLIDATEARDPIKVTLYAKNFSMPLQDFDLKKVSADVDLELGTMVLQDSWLLGAIGPKFQALDRQFNLSERQEARFSKLHVTLRDGKVKTNDLWMLTKDTLMGTQGLIDLVAGQVDMTLGISAQTLYRFSRQLRKYISADTVLEVPVRGPINHPRPNLSNLFGDITKALAQGALAEKAGKYGGLIELGIGALEGGGHKKGLSQRRPRLAWPNRLTLQKVVPVREKASKPKPTAAMDKKAKSTAPMQQTAPRKKKSEKRKKITVEDVLQGLFQ